MKKAVSLLYFSDTMVYLCDTLDTVKLIKSVFYASFSSRFREVLRATAPSPQ